MAAMVKLINCHRETRSCYHCGYTDEFIVLDGYEMKPPSPDDYCIGEKHHKRFGVQYAPELYDDIPFVRKATH